MAVCAVEKLEVVELPLVGSHPSFDQAILLLRRAVVSAYGQARSNPPITLVFSPDGESGSWMISVDVLGNGSDDSIIQSNSVRSATTAVLQLIRTLYRRMKFRHDRLQEELDEYKDALKDMEKVLAEGTACWP